MNLKTTTVAIVAILLLSACNTSKTSLPYFQDIETVVTQGEPLGDYTARIKPDDELLITINSAIPKATAHYNLPLSNPATEAELAMASTPRQQTYIVSSQGDITMPVLGTVRCEGLTCEQLTDQLTKAVRKDVPDAVVRVSMVNFQIVVSGEVASPGPVKVTRNRISVLDAISEAGDLTPYGRRDNVLVIREENGTRHFERLNLNTAECLRSPYFYLHQNDYVYVEPNEIRQANARFNQDNSYKLTVISTIVSAASVIASLVIALTVK